MSDAPGSTDRPTVLIVDDEPETADFYADALSPEYDVLTTYGGEAALEAMGPEVSVVLLDRRMPELSGDEVLSELRRLDVDCRVVMVTAVEPDIESVELPFDDYLIKPVSAAALREVVERMVARQTYDEHIQAVMALASRMATVEAKMSVRELEASREYAELQRRFEEVRDEIEDGGEGDLYPEFTAEKIGYLFG